MERYKQREAEAGKPKHSRLRDYIKTVIKRNEVSIVASYNMERLFRNKANMLLLETNDGHGYNIRGDRSVLIDAHLSKKIIKYDKRISVGKEFNCMLEDGTQLTITEIKKIGVLNPVRSIKHHNAGHQMIDKFSSMLAKNDLVLDSGSGYGAAARRMQNNGLSVIGIDIDEFSIEVSRKIARKSEFKKMDMTKTDFDDNTFNGVLNAAILAQGVDLKSLLKEDFRVLKPGGLLCITNIPVKKHEDEMHSAKNSIVEDVVYKNLKDAGFEIVEIKEYSGRFNGPNETKANLIDVIAKAKK